VRKNGHLDVVLVHTRNLGLDKKILVVLRQVQTHLRLALHQSVDRAQGKAFEKVVAEGVAQLAEGVQSCKIVHRVLHCKKYSRPCRSLKGGPIRDHPQGRSP
jgi:hypothetical protein